MHYNKPALYVLAAAVLCLPAPALAKTIPSGTYGCMGDMGGIVMAMGTIEIKGDTFRYAPPGGRLGAFRPYRMDAAGKISWGGPMGALNEAPSIIHDSFVEQRPAYRSIIVKYRPDGKGKGYILTMGCRNDTKPGH